ncbi:citrate lyase acyl carrier protein [Clostridium sp. Cult3]|uniref:citrate lyase acyl carrier protein n=1 Tax=Clostridium sp. Cult3 TaxID=2079004 RepID=UPI001F0259CC|nr:citrate lyase acyl carrier protein [Clostridium sp. Cult3]MCF6459937.1 citrate lyase acyl carrier protein [Clostridium sp. Cult3]
MKINKIAIAGSLESNDALVTIRPIEGGIKLEIDSIVGKQFFDRIEEVAYRTLEGLGVDSVSLKIQDRGALDCVLEARIETAVLRGGAD